MAEPRLECAKGHTASAEAPPAVEERENPLRVRRLVSGDSGRILRVINDAAEAYRGVIPREAWKEPYMDASELSRDLGEGVVMWGAEDEGAIKGVMGIQEKGDVTLIRHAYVITGSRRKGIGGRLLKHLKPMAAGPMLVGTWTAAAWAVSFYEKHGFTRLDPSLSASLLARYWNIPAVQADASIVLADEAWMKLAAMQETG